MSVPVLSWLLAATQAKAETTPVIEASSTDNVPRDARSLNSQLVPGAYAPNPQSHPLSQSYGAGLPTSLTHILPLD